jgi:hypothetical protein
MVDLQEVGWDFTRRLLMRVCLFWDLGTWAVLRYAWECVLQFASGTKIVWDMSIELSRICENGHDLNRCKDDDALGDV